MTINTTIFGRAFASTCLKIPFVLNINSTGLGRAVSRCFYSQRCCKILKKLKNILGVTVKRTHQHTTKEMLEQFYNPFFFKFFKTIIVCYTQLIIIAIRLIPFHLYCFFFIVCSNIRLFFICLNFI